MKRKENVIGKTIRKYRNYHGLSRRALGEKIDIDQGTIYRYETGEINPLIDTLKVIQKELDIPIAEFFSDIAPTKGYIATVEEKLFKYQVAEILEANPDLLEFVRKYGKNSADYKKSKFLKLIEKLAKIPPKKQKAKYDLIAKFIKTT